MGMFKEMMIEAEDALRAVRDLVQAMPALEDEGGVVQELLSTGDGGFLVMYETDVGIFRFTSEGDTTCLVEESEYNLAKASSMDLTRSVPELMELVNATH